MWLMKDVVVWVVRGEVVVVMGVDFRYLFFFGE